MGRCPAGVRRPIEQNHVTLALASLTIGPRRLESAAASVKYVIPERIMEYDPGFDKLSRPALSAPEMEE